MLANRLDSIYDHPEHDDPDVEVELLKRGINIRLASNDLFKINFYSNPPHLSIPIPQI